MRVEYFAHGNPASPAVMISPAFTGSARVYADSFGAALSNYYVIAVQLRGHGNGGGCEYEGIHVCTSLQAPDAGSYNGFRMSRLAADLEETRLKLGLGKTALLGHSMGMSVIAEYISNYGTDGITGLIVYDQSPRGLGAGVPEVASFPPTLASYPFADLVALVESYSLFEPGQNYVNVATNVRAMLGGTTGDPVYNPHRGEPAFVLTQAAWQKWASFANRMNGKVLGMMLWSSLTTDYTDFYQVIRASRLPVLVYGGKSSIVPWQAMQWVHEQLPGSEFMLFEKGVGVHGAFLNPPPSGTEFMRRILSFLDRRVRPRALAARQNN